MSLDSLVAGAAGLPPTVLWTPLPAYKFLLSLVVGQLHNYLITATMKRDAFDWTALAAQRLLVNLGLRWICNVNQLRQSMSRLETAGSLPARYPG